MADRRASPSPVRRALAALLLVALVPVALDGCVSVGVSRRPLGTPGEASAVSVAFFEKTKDRDANRPLSSPVFSRLLRAEEGGAETVAARSMASRWSLEGLPPGRYRLEATKRIDAHGDVVPLSDPVDEKLDLRAGETLKADVVLSKVPVFWVVLAAVTVVVLVVLVIVAVDSGDLPLPPLPPPEAVVVAADLAAEALIQGSEASAGRAALAPAVADVFPAPDSVVAARRVAVTFLLTRPIDPDEIPEGAVLSLGSSSGEIPGTAAFLEGEQALRFVPSRDFTPGESVLVTLDLSLLRSPEGAAGSGRFTTRFTVPEEDEED